MAHVPVAGLQVPATWQASAALQVTGLPPVQVPLRHWSVRVQALLSLQVVPSALFGLEQTPVELLQVPTLWHWSSAVHTTGLLPVQVPLWQLSDCVQELPSVQAVPFDFGEQIPTDPARLQDEH
jgi:hypothetical protein